jgi:hypothetical protein
MALSAGSIPVSVQLYKNLRVVYYPVGGLPFTKDNCGDTAKGGMPT